MEHLPVIVSFIVAAVMFSFLKTPSATGVIIGAIVLASLEFLASFGMPWIAIAWVSVFVFLIKFVRMSFPGAFFFLILYGLLSYAVVFGVLRFI